MEAEGNKGTADGALRKGANMNLDAVTVQDCLDMYEKKRYEAVIADGKISYFVEREEK